MQLIEKEKKKDMNNTRIKQIEDYFGMELKLKTYLEF